MVLARVNLLLQSGDAGPVLPHQDKQVFAVEAIRSIAVVYFYVCEPLPVRAYFVLALDDENSPDL
jgi:hypothetical protein